MDIPGRVIYMQGYMYYIFRYEQEHHAAHHNYMRQLKKSWNIWTRVGDHSYTKTYCSVYGTLQIPVQELRSNGFEIMVKG